MSVYFSIPDPMFYPATHILGYNILQRLGQTEVLHGSGRRAVSFTSLMFGMLYYYT